MKPRDLRNGALAAAVVLVLCAETLLACPYTTCLDCSSGSVPGVGLGNGAQGCASPTSSHPVRYFDGLLLYKTPAIGFPSADGSWSFSLTYNNRPEDAVAWIDEHFGYNWYPSIPRLEFRTASLIKMIGDGHTATDYVWDGTAQKFLGQHGVWAEIRTESGYYKLRGTNGGEAWFFQTGGNKGKLYKTVSPYGKEWVCTYSSSPDGKGGNLLFSITEPGAYGWYFAYGTGYRVSYITVSNGGTPLARIDFTYYTSTTSDGVAGNLKRMTIDRDPADGTSPVQEITFRYWVGSYDPENDVFGQTHDLKMVIGAMASKVAARAQGQSLDNLSTSTLYSNKYFDLYAEYQDDHRVAFEEVQTGQCSCGGDGQVGQYSYGYYDNGAQISDYTTPKRAVIQVNPDGSRHFVEVNRVGSAISIVHQETASPSSRRWAQVYTHDSSGQIVEVFHPSACNPTNYTAPSWSHAGVSTIDSGHVDVFEYYSGSQFSSDRALWGKIKARYVQEGTDTGTRKKLEEYVYLDSGYPGRHLWKHRIYRTANTYNETIYSYTYSGGDYDKVTLRTTTHPTVDVPASQGSASRTETFNSTSGVLVSVTQEDGIIDLYNHSGATGLLADKTSDATGVGSLQLFETWDYDSWGRRIRHTTYDGSTTAAPKLKVERWLYTHMAADTGDETYYPRFVEIAYEHLVENAGNVSVRDGLARIVVRDLDGNVVEEADGFRSTTGQALSSDFDKTDASLHVAFEGTEYRRKTYVYLGGVLRKEHAWLNAQSGESDRYTTAYEYDVMGRRTKRIAPDTFSAENFNDTAEGGTTEWEYDVRGNLVKTYVYISTKGAPIEERYYDYNEPGSIVNAGDDLLTRVDRLVGADAQNPVRRITEYDYDWEDHLIATAEKVTGSYSRVTENDYDYSGRIVTVSTYFGARNSGAWEPYYDATMGAAKKLWKEEVTWLYDERSRLYQESRTWSEIVDGPPDAGQTYVTKTWHDKRNRTLKATTPRGSFTKYEYDRVGRTKAIYRGYDIDEGVDFADADDVTGDVILSQNEVQYDRAGREIYRTRYERKPEEQIASSQTGALDANKARRSFAAWWYSGAGRTTASVDWGDNQGGDPEVPVRNTTPPEQSDDVLVTEYEYHYGGDADALYPDQEDGTTWVMVTDPAEKVHYTFQDNLGRDLRTIRNYYSGGTAGAPGTYYDAGRGITVQRNITSSFRHDGSGHLVRAVAHDQNPSTGGVTKQVTAYEYGVGTGDSPGASEVASLDLVRRISYGHDSGSETFSEQIVLGYNRQGQVIWRGESAYGPPGSATYRAPHSYAYDLLGQLAEDSVGSTTADVDTSIKALAYEYDSHGRLAVAKSLDGSATVVNTVTRKYNKHGFLAESTQDHGATWSKTVTYGYSDGPGGSKDLSSVTYPSIGGSSRVVSYARTDTGDEWDKADRMTGRVSKIEATLSGNTDRVQYTYMGAATPMRTTYGTSPTATLELLGGSTSLALDRFGRPNRLKAVANGTTVFEYAYTYDRRHSLEVKDGDGTPFLDETFEYDDIGRLGEFDPEGASNTRTWKLTGIGNWDTVYYNGSSIDERTHDAQNEITSRTVEDEYTVHPYEYPPSYVPYDVAGNLMIAPTDAPAALSDRMLLVYDAWNRLVKIKDDDGSPTKAFYERDALGRIIRESQLTEHYFYSEDWQILSVLNEISGQDTRVREYVWGTRYVDELAMSYSGASRRYHLQDTNWNVVATLDHQVARLEAIRYDPYGQPYFYTFSNGQYTGPSDWESSRGTDFAFQGRWYQKFLTDEGRLRLYDFRNRAYLPTLGRFAQRDPIGAWGDYSNLGNGYSYAGDNPIGFVDPFGAQAEAVAIGIDIGKDVAKDIVKKALTPQNWGDLAGQEKLDAAAKNCKVEGTKDNLQGPACQGGNFPIEKYTFTATTNFAVSSWVSRFTVRLQWSSNNGCDLLSCDLRANLTGDRNSMVEIKSASVRQIASVAPHCNCCKPACVEARVSFKLTGWQLPWNAVYNRNIIVSVCADGTSSGWSVEE